MQTLFHQATPTGVCRRFRKKASELGYGFGKGDPGISSSRIRKKGTKIGIEGSNSTKKNKKKRKRVPGRCSTPSMECCPPPCLAHSPWPIANKKRYGVPCHESTATSMGTSVFILRNLGKQSVRSRAQRLAHWPWAEAPDLAEATRCQCLLKTLAQWKGGTGTTNISGHRKCTHEWK